MPGEGNREGVQVSAEVHQLQQACRSDATHHLCMTDRSSRVIGDVCFPKTVLSCVLPYAS